MLMSNRSSSFSWFRRMRPYSTRSYSPSVTVKARFTCSQATGSVPEERVCRIPASCARFSETTTSGLSAAPLTTVSKEAPALRNADTTPRESYPPVRSHTGFGKALATRWAEWTSASRTRATASAPLKRSGSRRAVLQYRVSRGAFDAENRWIVAGPSLRTPRKSVRSS